MESLFKALVLFSFLFSTNTYAQAEECIKANDMKEIAEHFSQFKDLLDGSNKYCADKIGENWVKIGLSLVTLKNITPDEPSIDSEDALTLKAISENNWWDYFTARAKKFVVEANCSKGVGAFVRPFLNNGLIHLCKRFFEINVASQAAIMMHEVRHFDGHGHVTCEQGSEKGKEGSCDQKITDKGSYAINVQTLVGLARSVGTPVDQKPLLEAEAIYMAFNKFNVVPKIKIEHSIYLSNSLGKVYEWVIGVGASLVNTLDEPSKVIASGGYLTIYPLAVDIDAYRLDHSLKFAIENPGLYAKHYNSQSVEERASFKSVGYFGAGGLLKDNSITTLCNLETEELGTENLDSQGQFKRIISMSRDDNDEKRGSFLLAKDGGVFHFECADQSSDKLKFKNTGLTFTEGSRDIIDAFGLAGDQYALTEDGVLKMMSLQGHTITTESLSLPIANSHWVSASPIKRAEVF